MNTCRAGRNCRSPGMTNPADGLCVPCELAVRRAIDSLAADYAALGGELAPGSGSGESTIRGKAVDAPLPLREDIDVAMRRIRWVLCEWVTPVREVLKFHRVDPWLLQHDEAVGWASRVLSLNFSVLLALSETPYRDYRSGEWLVGDGVDAALQIWHAHRKTLSTLGETRIWEQRKMPCPAEPMSNGCGAYALGTWIGSGKIECSKCGWSCTQDDYMRYVMTMTVPRSVR